MSEDLIKDQLEQLNTKELVNLIMNLIQRGGQTRLNALEWLEANSENKKPSNSNKSKNSQKIHDEMLFDFLTAFADENNLQILRSDTFPVE